MNHQRFAMFQAAGAILAATAVASVGAWLAWNPVQSYTRAKIERGEWLSFDQERAKNY